MKFNSEDSDSDYFDGPDLPEEEKKPKEPELHPDDPNYWDQPEDEFEHLRGSGDRRRRRRWYLYLILGCVVIALAVFVWLRWFVSYADGATQYGYVEGIERRGTIFKTFEGQLLPYKNLMDTTRSYDGDFIFSAANDKVASQLKRYQYANRPVRVEYSRYHAPLPWRGESRIVVTHVDTVNPRDILPPEYLPDIHK